MLKAPVAHDGYGRVALRLLRWLLIVLLICLGPRALILLLEGDQREARARTDLSNLLSAAQALRARNGAPADCRWLPALVAAGLLEREPHDPWGGLYLVQLDAVSDRLTVRSTGADAVMGTEDDLMVESPATSGPPGDAHRTR